MEITKEERIKKELVKIRKIFKDMPKDKLNIVSSLMQNAAFMAVTLEDLQQAINDNGVISTYQNGANQWGTKKSPEAEMYNALIKNYSSIIKQLTDLLPKENQNVVNDELVEFLKVAK